MSLIVESNRLQPTTLEKHVMTLRRLVDRRAMAEYMAVVCESAGPEMARALHQAYADGWTLDQARVADIAAAQPVRGCV